MATYEEIYGKRVDVLDTDPTLNSSYEGQVWYNSTSGTLKGVVQSSAWSSSSIMTISKFAAQGGGIQTAAFVAGGGPGSSPPFPGNASVTTVEYNGTGWSSGGDLGMARYAGASAGTLTAGILAAGYNQQSPYGRNLTETYDGTSWTEVGDLSTARYNTGSAIGTQTALVVGNGIQFSGGPSATLLPTATVEEFDGSSWTAGGDRGTASIQGVSYGTLTAGVSATGGTALPAGPNVTTAVKNYDGTSWTAAPALNAARRELGGGGVQTAAIVFGGDPHPGSSTNATETFDGTSWATSPATMGTALKNMGFSSNSTSTAAFAGGGSNPGPVTNVTEEWNVSAATITAAAWASGTAMNTPRKAMSGGYGTTTAGLIAGGHSAPNAGIADSEEFDGSSWTEGPNMNTARGWIACCGTQTAALGAGGYTGPPNTAGVTSTEEYDGSNWTNGGSLSQSVYGGGGFGSQTAGVKAGGYNNTLPPGNVTTQTEEYNGSAWSTNPNGMGTGRYAMAGSGPSTAGLVAGGYQYDSPAGQTTKTEEFDGTNWTTGGAMMLSRKGLASSGNSQTACLVFGGNASNSVIPSTYSGYTEGYDGTTWSTRPSMATGRDGVGGSYAGTQTAAFVAGGYLGPPGQTNAVEEFTGEVETVTAKTLTTS